MLKNKQEVLIHKQASTLGRIQMAIKIIINWAKLREAHKADAGIAPCFDIYIGVNSTMLNTFRDYIIPFYSELIILSLAGI